MSEEKAVFNFGDYAIVGSHEYRFAKMPDFWWSFKPVTSGSEVARSKFIMYNRVAETIDGVRFEQPPTAREIAHRELALQFDGTNLQTSDGKPAIRENATIPEIEAFIDCMPPGMVNELWVELGRLFPKWGPADPKDWTEKE